MPNFLIGLMKISVHFSFQVRDHMKMGSTETHLEYEQAPVKDLWIISPISLIKTLFGKSYW